MIDPILSLALAIQSNPGVYALLLGSGVSRAAKIPTGWEVVQDLSRKLAKLLNENPEPDPAAWYRTKFNKDPDYADLLNEIAKTPTERQQLLRSYFEPNEQEREDGFKRPTRAHHAIAKLVAAGHVRVILTTNFDKLIEQAIQDEGIAPTVISTPDAVEGALPLVHQKCCIIKLHGDYLDMRIKNTVGELASYDERVNRLLDQILDQFGLVVCGWSTLWDTALRAAIERSPNRRFSTFWASLDDPPDPARRLIQLRAAQTLRIDEAEVFFPRVTELVTALEQSQRPHPASVAAATALVKRYLVEDRYRVDLADLVALESETAHSRIEALCDQAAMSSASTQKVANIEQLFGEYRESIAILQAMLIHGIAHGHAEHDRLWISALERTGCYEKQSGTILKEGIRQYPVVVLSYAAGLAALANNRIACVVRLLTEPRYRDLNETRPLLLAIDWSGISESIKRMGEPFKSHYTPLSEHISPILRDHLRRYLPNDGDFEEVFDRLEYVRAIAYVDLEHKTISETSRIWAPPGRYWYKGRHYGFSISKVLDEEIQSYGKDLPLLKAGLCHGSLDRLLSVKHVIDNFKDRVSW